MLFLDIGSTYTKGAVIDERKARLLGVARSPTTVETDISIGVRNVIDRLLPGLEEPETALRQRFASSSAAGGLRLVAIGLVPDLTLEAARRAALGAGAKVVGSFAHKLTSGQVSRIEQIAPEIVLLAGGTDGGNEETILHNAHALARARITAPVVVAGNSVVAERVAEGLREGSKEVFVTENVMPEISMLNVEPARQAIREVFMRRIVRAKGLDKVESFIDGVLMPTPLAVLNATRVIAEHIPEMSGGVMVIDVGGATTDVHSVSAAEKAEGDVVLKGLPEPYAKRTVEGDLGVRYNVKSIVEAAGEETVLRNAGLDGDSIERLRAVVETWSSQTELLPSGPEELALDRGLARSAVEIAVTRHVGYLDKVYTPMGAMYCQFGKDFTGVKALVGTGGPLVHAPDPASILSGCLYRADDPLRLRPKSPTIYLDRGYLLFAVGLLAEFDAGAAARLATEQLVPIRVVA